MGSEKESNKTLRICGSGSVRKNKGRWQAVVSLIDEETGTHAEDEEHGHRMPQR